MRLFSKTALTGFIMALAAAMPSNALVLDNDYLKAKITEDLNNKYQSVNPDGAVVVKSLPLVDVDLKGTKLTIDCSCNFGTFGKNKMAKVIFLEDNRILKTIVVPVEIKAYDNVLVATKDILRGETLNSTNTKYEKRSVEYNSANVIAENFDFSDMTSKRTIKAGDIIDKRFLGKQTAIFRSSPVVAVFQSGAIRLSLEVTAMENGGIGDYIKVRSKEYNKIYQGKVISSNQVLIQI